MRSFKLIFSFILFATILSCKDVKLKEDLLSSDINLKAETQNSVQLAPGDTLIRIQGTSQGVKEDHQGNYVANPQLIIANGISSGRYYVLRTRFNHPNINSERIKNVTMYLTFRRTSEVSSGDSHIQFQIPYHFCDASIPFGGSLNQDLSYELVRCIQNAYLGDTFVFPNSNSGKVTFKREFNSSTTTPAVNILLQNPHFFTIGMLASTNGSAVHLTNAYADIVYTKQDFKVDTTVRIGAVNQGIRDFYSFPNGSTYSNNPQSIVGQNISTGTYLVRSRFDHPTIPNDKIKNVVINWVFKKHPEATGSSSRVQFQIPFNACNSSLPFTGNISQSQYSSIIDCIKNAYLGDTYAISNSLASNFTISRNFKTLANPSLATLLQNPKSFTVGMFAPLSNEAVQLVQVNADITYLK